MSQSKANKPCDQNAQGQSKQQKAQNKAQNKGQSGGSFTGGAGNSNNGGPAGT